MMSSRSRIALAAAVIAALAGAAVVLRPASKRVAETPSASAARRVGIPNASPAVEVDGKPAHRARRELGPAPDPDAAPASLRGTEVDGWIGADDAGHLVVTPGARWFFDYFLSAAGEESAEAIHARIVAEIDARLPADAAREAVDLLDRYLAYRDRVRSLYAAGPSEDLAERLQALHRIRVDAFGDADASALFGEEEAVQALDIERRAVLADRALTAEERERRLDAIEARLPTSVREARGEAMAAARLTRDEQALREAGGTAEDVHALREQRFGADAAGRLAALDAERAEWEQRFADYRQARAQIQRDRSLDDENRARALEALLEERFSAAEQVRANALNDALDGSGHPIDAVP